MSFTRDPGPPQLIFDPGPTGTGNTQTRNAPAPSKAPPSAAAPPRAIPRGLAPNYYIYFYAVDRDNPASWSSFSVLAGDTPPRITGGYAKWTVIDRPLWRGLTVFSGYDPILMEMTVRFMSIQSGSWLDDDAAGGRVEGDIGRLEWMAGNQRVEGAPAYVYLSTANGNGKTTALIPFVYQNSSTSNVPASLKNQNFNPPWVIVGIDWDQNPVRNASGLRVRQDATVTVQMYVGTDQPPSVAHRTNPTLKSKALAFYARQGADTPLAIARQVQTAPDRVALAKAIIKWPANAHLHLRSINSPIKNGTKVWVPYNY